ncbi:MAG TPA: phosphatidylserine/phosphatidylglycerophosphate/cardiolipin synthase family protein [Kofleriaceae bacterium]|nr:phosphatidylserine/phosphatidylglycerophosphate/cardiolipin synthase family protein [Kofleriaceae bacterium]
MTTAGRPAPSSPPSRLPDGVPEPIDDAPSRAIAVELPPALRPYARSPIRWRVGCDVTVLRDGGQTYKAMLDAIVAAKRSICFETYILAGDTTGDRFKIALVERARAGIEVRLIYDAVGSFGLSDAWVSDLRAAGIEVIAFNPIAPWRQRFRLSHRDHRKMLVVDDEVGFTGGLNIANDYAAVEDGGVGWHDMHCRVTGPIVYDMARGFRRNWIRAGGKTYPPVRRPSSSPTGEGTSYVRLLENALRRQRTGFRRAYLHVMRAAHRTIRIENAYFLPDRGIRRALVAAARRGVDVQVIVPGRSDVKLIEYASLYALRHLAKRGIKVWRWSGIMLHAKTAVVDAIWSTIGSYNFDSQSRFNNLEVTVEILDPVVGEKMVRVFDNDVPNCTPYDEATWKNLPWWTKSLAWLGYRLRRFL